MNRLLLSISLLISITIIGCEEPVVLEGDYGLVPLPNQMMKTDDSFYLSNSTQIGVVYEEDKAVAEMFAAQFFEVSGWSPSVQVGESGDILITRTDELAEEGYRLKVENKKIYIEAGSSSGVFYAFQSLAQLLHPSYQANVFVGDKTWSVPGVVIEDAPAFEWRGYMLDVSRHFFTVDQVKKVLDFMAELKMNRFHWHLADDQGWRVEIKQYPKLTEVGAWRVNYNTVDERVSNWWGRPGQTAEDEADYGGFYTQEEIKEIIQYAKERFIEVVPEIDMPGHAQATIAAYPEIGCVNAAPYVATGGVFKNNTYNPGKEETFEFVENMLSEIMDLFPYEYIHIGGDECNKSQWMVDPDAQRRMREEGLSSVEELQSYFIRRVEKIINDRGRKMIGWDEILEGGLAPNAVVMSWRGEKGGIESVKMGHEVIMTPNEYCYIDLKQGHDDLEPNLGYSQLLLSKAYSYRVIPESFSEEEGSLIKGVQANMWTESISDWGKLAYMNYPRIYAIAETGWTHYENKEWDDFTDRLSHQFDLLELKKERYSTSAFSPWILHEAAGEGIDISFSTEVNDLEIRFTRDGSEPNASSELYNGPFRIQEDVKIMAKSFRGDEPVGITQEKSFSIHKAAGHSISGVDSKLIDHNYARLHPGDENWTSLGNSFEAEIQFEEPTPISSVEFDALRFTISGIYPPENVVILVAGDDGEFESVYEGEVEGSSVQGRNKVRFSTNFEERTVSKIRIKGVGYDSLPEGHHRAGEKSRMLIDELVIK